MHVHLPKPLHGWREFVGEVGIIVVGVLIAIGAEQVVETLHWRNEARDFRVAINHELALNLGTFKVYVLQHECIRRRLDELDLILRESRSGAPIQLTGTVSGPLQLSQYSSVWDNKDAQVVAHLPADLRLKYAELYDEFRNTNDVKSRIGAIWSKFVPIEEPGPLSLADRRELHALIEAARGADKAMVANWVVAEKLGDGLGIHAELPTEDVEISRKIPQSSICKPIVKS